MKILELDQEGETWKTWREAGLGSSDAPIVMGVSKYTTREKLKRIKLGQVKARKFSAKMLRGKDLEPVARDLYHLLRGIHTRPVCVIHDQYDWLRASLDGLSDNNKRILEIKCVNKLLHRYALEKKEVPPEYFPQVQHQLLVTELVRLDYWSYSESSDFSKQDQIVLVEVVPDQEYMQRLFEEEQRFLREVGLLKSV